MEDILGKDEKEQTEKNTKDALKEISKKGAPQFIQTGDHIVNITHKGEGNIYTEHTVNALVEELKYLRQLVISRDDFIQENMQLSKNIILLKDEKIENLRAEIDHLNRKIEQIEQNSSK